MTLDPNTLEHLRGLLDAAGERGAVAVVDDLLLLAEVATERAAPPVPAEPPRQERAPRAYTASNLRGAFFAVWGRLFGKLPKTGEALDSKVRRVAVLRQWWGIESASAFTADHANGPRGVAWLSSLAQDPQELNYAIHAAIKADLRRPFAAELEATDAA